jgi:hypothetical protein
MISGSVQFTAISVMEGGPHSLSSMYKSLYYSLLYICSDGERPRSADLNGLHSLLEMAAQRRVSMQRHPLPVPPRWKVAQQHVPLISALHKLFFSAEEPCCRQNVSIKQFPKACQPFSAGA